MASPNFSGSTLRFQVTFNLATGYFNIVDLLSAIYSPMYGLTVANLREMFKISFSAPGISSTVVYCNAGWDTDDFTSADIDGSTSIFTFSGADLYLDSDGLPLKGTYTFESKVTFGAAVYTTNNTYNYQYTSPSVVIDETVNCQTSTLTSVDSTDYTVDLITPTIYRAHTITKPTGSSAADPGTTYSATATNTRTVGGGSTLSTVLWTKTWQILIHTHLTYTMQTWGVYPFILIYDEVNGYQSVGVSCASGSCCDVRQCVLNLTELWKSYKGVDPVSYARVGAKLYEVNVEWMNFEFAQGCGELYDEFCTNLVNICKSENCATPAADTAPQPIYPVSSGGISVTPSSFAFTVSSVDLVGTSSGTSGDLHFYTDNSTKLYLQQNVAGTWTQVSANLYVSSTIAPTPATIIINDSISVGTDAGTSEKDFDLYNFIPSSYTDADGDVLHVYAMFQLAKNDNGKTMKMYFGGDIIVQKFTDSLINALNDIVVLEMWITRTGSATQSIVGKVERYGEVINTFSTNTKDLTASQDIKITGQNSVAAANDIVAKVFKIELIKMMPALP